MPKPDPFPPLRKSSDEASSTVATRVREGADLFKSDTRYTSDMHERFENWFRATATDLEQLFWSDGVANWFREGTCWLVGPGDYRGIIDTRDDRLKILEELKNLIKAPSVTEMANGNDYDVCLSFAGEQRKYVDQVADELRKAGVRVFYDRYEQVDLWGKDLYEHLNGVYRDRARYCVIFVSKDYAEKQWTSHERKSAQARAFRESREYILPVRFDDTELPGLNDTVGYVDGRNTTPAELAQMIIQKLRGSPAASAEGRADNRATAANVGAAETALEAVWNRRDVRIESERHDYRLMIDLHNIGRRKVEDWRVQVWMPNAFVPDSRARTGHKLIEEADHHYSETGKRLLPGDRLHVLDIDYFVDDNNWPNSPWLPKERRDEWKVRIRVSADGMNPWETEIPMADLQNF